MLLMAIAAVVCGCTVMSSTAGPQPVPRVEDCAIVTVSSPIKYACGGKVYTAFQLTRLRNEQAKEYTSGK
jgi:hypothetical protein